MTINKEWLESILPPQASPCLIKEKKYMDHNEFWKLIESVNATVSHKDQEAFFDETVKTLSKLSLDDVMDWHLILNEYKKAAYRNELWAASAAIGAHHTDDGFIDFRSWLISCGHQTYMDAMQNPDSLATMDTAGDYLNFEQFGYAASYAYDQISGEEDGLYDKVKHRKLVQQVLEEIHTELPQRPDIRSEWSLSELPKLFPQIWAKTHEHQKAINSSSEIKKMLDGGNILIAYVYNNCGARDEYMFPYTPENIAYFIGGHREAKKMILTDILDCLILDTIGYFIDHCPNQALLESVKETLIPIQMGEAEAMPFFCPTMEEVDDYCIQVECDDMQFS